MKTKQVILGSRDSYGRYEVKKNKNKKKPHNQCKNCQRSVKEK